jgi:hypothetical protein
MSTLEKGQIVLFLGEKYRVSYAGPTKRGPRVCIVTADGEERWCDPDEVTLAADQTDATPTGRPERRPLSGNDTTRQINGHDGGAQAQLALCLATLRDIAQRMERLESVCIGIAEKLEVV